MLEERGYITACKCKTNVKKCWAEMLNCQKKKKQKTQKTKKPTSFALCILTMGKGNDLIITGC